MPDALASIDFLADLELYKQEKPFAALASPGVEVSDDQLNNLQWESHVDITIKDIRGRESEYPLERCGFQIVKHRAQTMTFTSKEDIESYRRETESQLLELLGVTRVYCWEARVRQLYHGLKRMKELKTC